MKNEYPKMVYKNEKKEIVQHKDEVGYHWKVVESKDQHDELGSEWGDHPELSKEAPKAELESKDEKHADSKHGKKHK